MKKQFNVLILAILLSFSYSCSKDEQQAGMSNPFKTELISDNLVKEKVLTWQKMYFESKGESKSNRFQNVEFDYDNLSLTSKPSGLNDVILARQVNYNEANSVNYAISFFENNKNIVNALVIKIENVSKDIKRVHYLSLENILLVTVEVNLKNSKSNIIFKNNNLDSSNNKGLMKIDVGQCTANCIGDAYTNHGWASVAAWVVSAFFPEAVAAIALDCAANCALINAGIPTTV
jgi:hypothetical protein